ncbi:uncharacterized protein [Drosophila bipectinata]|uniref:uncharacterized protein n=1 Tax=Drosophila bipectinata TaxID=42026 RepID=UPI001C8AADEA|nr:uncharacterized protein LOC108132465 [Drosophila bipectinata]
MAKDQYGNPIAEGYGPVHGSATGSSSVSGSGSGPVQSSAINSGPSGGGVPTGCGVPGSAPLLNSDLTDEQRREQRARLIKALSRFKPRDANPLQFYNCVRELCIMHNCSIDEGLERAALTWPGLSMAQRELYDSQRHAELPIPVPKHLVYRAFQKERNGLWSLGRAPANNHRSTRYTVESYKPPPKQSRLRTQLADKRPKYDNLLELPPKVAAARVPPPHNPKVSRVSPSSGRRIRSPTPPTTLRRVTSIREILSMDSIEGKKARRRQAKSRLRKAKNLREILEAEKPVPEKVTAPDVKPMKTSKKRGSRGQKKAVRLEEEKAAAAANWELAIGCVRRRLMMHQPNKV